MTASPTLPSDMEILTTGDGSPTLAFKRADGYVEKMHHTAGALGESLYIYREALRLALEFPRPLRVLSLGLGLGYNEMITVAGLHRADSEAQDWEIWSFEALPYLRDGFAVWLRGASGGGLDAVFERVLEGVAGAHDLEPRRLKSWLSSALAGGRLHLMGAFPQAAAGLDKINVIYYDAYSGKMDPHLWGEEHLKARLGACAAPRCVLATYAATGALNRALKGLGFRLLPKAGFEGKRQSTLAVR
jgi:tRNA U34 5-methylaminomethyl-2-thiouridine-forming methyltransferase MnmC